MVGRRLGGGWEVVGRRLRGGWEAVGRRLGGGLWTAINVIKSQICIMLLIITVCFKNLKGLSG